jgi:uncharacterized protein (TIGR02453 family)
LGPHDQEQPVSTYFDDGTYRFLRALAKNNSREWFQAHKAEYEAHVRAPALALIADLQPALRAVSPHYRAEAKATGGSLFRIHRDTRFSNDKTPYKTHAGMYFFHARHKQVEAPGYYLHVEPGRCFVGAGLWHPQPDTQRKVRQFIHDNPAAWTAAVRSPAFRRRYGLADESLQRPPRGFPADHPLIEDLKRKNFVASTEVDQHTVLGPRLRQTMESHFKGLAPLVDYLCAALDLEF